jgi:ribosomal protein L9
MQGDKMQHIQVWRAARMWLVGLVVFTAATALSGVLPGVGIPIAEASVAQDKQDDKDKEKKEKQRDAAQLEDTTLNGQVVEINTLKDPPELIVGSVDGAVVVRVLKTDEIALNGVKVGHYVELTGEKIHELLFEATEISVDNSDN